MELQRNPKHTIYFVKIRDVTNQHKVNIIKRIIIAFLMIGVLNIVYFAKTKILTNGWFCDCTGSVLALYWECNSLVLGVYWNCTGFVMDL